MSTRRILALIATTVTALTISGFVAGSSRPAALQVAVPSHSRGIEPDVRCWVWNTPGCP
jgi:hypothetical protein